MPGAVLLVNNVLVMAALLPKYAPAPLLVLRLVTVMVFRWKTEALTLAAPAKTAPPPKLAAVLLVKVEAFTVAAVLKYAPPPPLVVVLLLNVVAVTLAVSLKYTPPPLRLVPSVRLLLKSVLETSAATTKTMPPPWLL